MTGYSWPANFSTVLRTSWEGRVKVVSSTQCRLLHAVRLPRSRTYTVAAELTTGRTPSSSSLTFCYNTTTRGHLRTFADSVTLSTHRHHWPVADVTAPTPCRRVWSVAASTVCRHPAATPWFSRCRADHTDNSSPTIRTSQLTSWRCPLRCSLCRVARTHSRCWKLIKFNVRLRHFGRFHIFNDQLQSKSKSKSKSNSNPS